MIKDILKSLPKEKRDPIEDYISDLNRTILVLTRKATEATMMITELNRKLIGRNSKCGCGSFKKYKQCCGRVGHV